MAAFNYTANPDELNEGFDVLPPVDYVAELRKSALNKTNAGTGHNLDFEFIVLEGSRAGRVFFDCLCIDNPSAKAQEIAQRSLNSLCVATGKLGIEDTTDLHSIPVLVRLKVVPATGNYPAKNEVVSYKPVPQGGVKSGGGQQSSGGEQQVSEKKDKKPWE